MPPFCEATLTLHFRTHGNKQREASPMSINVETETLIPLAQLARSLPRRRSNRPVAPSTVHRWRMNGLDGVRLEAVKVGGSWHTTREAFQRFCDRLTAAAEPGPANASVQMPTRSRRPLSPGCRFGLVFLRQVCDGWTFVLRFARCWARNQSIDSRGLKQYASRSRSRYGVSAAIESPTRGTALVCPR